MTAAHAHPGEHAELDPQAALLDALEHAAHLLPAQAPLQAFVHHNTLHSFEHLPFEQALVDAGNTFDSQIWPSEDDFARHLARGRITPRDIAAVLEDEGIDDQPVIPGGPGRRALWQLRLEQLYEVPVGAPLSWLLSETPALRRFHRSVDADARARVCNGKSEVEQLAALWKLVMDAVVSAGAQPAPRMSMRPRDRVLELTGVDVDTSVHPTLLRLAAAYLDQGTAYWSMPERQLGFYACVRALYRRPFGPPDPWMHALRETLDSEAAAGLDAEQSALASLERLRVPRVHWAEVITSTLLSLRGWAGMFYQLQLRPDRAPVEAPPPCRLVDFLAVHLLLESHAVRHVLDEHKGFVSPSGLKGHLLFDERSRSPQVYDLLDHPLLALAWDAFVLTQRAGVSPEQLAEPGHARTWVHTVAKLGPLERRRLLFLAYERHYRVHVLDSLLAHAKLGVREHGPAKVQMVFCIDDREESLRRHVEELDPEIETHGYAGFFSVAMAFRSAEAVRSRPLCPVVIEPRHLVVEELVDASGGEAARKRALGRLRHASFVGSKTFVRGSLVSVGVGLAAMVPLVTRTLFPRAAQRLNQHARRVLAGSPRTRLLLERPEGEGPQADGMLHGYTVEEMTNIVGELVRTIGIDDHLGKLVLICGHGSSSLNNPHEAAYGCGATGGGCGGPNARVWTTMANDPRVRERLRARGVIVPDETWFVGCYHDTCDDSIHWYDLDRIPESHKAEFDRIQALLDQACRLHAHERCRRFESAPLGLTPDGALAHVEGRAADLAQPRPELGHVTNAICFFGRRERTRGLFLDRRAFLVSYEPERDPDGTILGALLQAAGPVGAGISLEYLFSYVDNLLYGAGTKLPHNITGLLAVMDGHASDLRTGLPRQMIEIHEPMRLLTIIETEPDKVMRVLAERPALERLVRNEWIQTVVWSPTTGLMHVLSRGRFVVHQPDSDQLRVVQRSVDHYRGHRDHLECARVEAGI